LLTDEEDLDYEDEEEDDEELDDEGLNYRQYTFFFAFYPGLDLCLSYLYCHDCGFVIYFLLLLPSFCLKVRR
jgi:hypothetical protein